MNPTAPAQQRIVAWFDSTYERLGARYLRPLRAYLVYPELMELTGRDEVLDVACGLGMFLLAASPYTSRLHGCDISAVAVREARARVPGARLSVANAEALPYASATFDVLTCFGSLERMLDRRRALAEMLRVGKPGARYCYLVRNANTLGWRYLGRRAARDPARGHADADTLANWTRLFRSAGFEIRQVLPDQYPLVRRRAWRSFPFGSPDYRTPETSHANLERANEFVFVLRKPM